MESHACAWLVIITILSACTCGVRTTCNGPTQISLLTGVHDDPACRKISPKGVLLYEAAQFIAEAHNNKTTGFKIDLAVVDTCDSIAGAMKAAMKALVRADVNCLQPPYYLGIIGPDTMTNAEAVQKVTSVLRVPQIVRKASNSPFLHFLPKESDEYIVQGILKIMEALNWKTFTLVAHANENDDDDVQNIAKKLTMEAIAKDLCVLVHDDEEDDFLSHVVHIGKPANGFFAGPVNATVLVVSEGNLKNYLNRVNSTNTILLLEDDRDDLDGLENRVQKSKWWAEENAGKYDSEELRDARWLQEAVKVYTDALSMLCKKKKCKNQVNPTDWNNVLTNALATHITEAKLIPKVLELSIRVKNSKLLVLGRVKIDKNKANLQWKNENESEEVDGDNDSSVANDDDDNEDVPNAFKKLISKEKKRRNGCATLTDEIKSSHDDEDEAAHIFVSELDDSEWWTMVMTVSGVGLAMFSVGILAVYIVYTNIRGPVTPKSLERDASIRRVGSERGPSTITQRVMRGPQRRDSTRSIASNISEKSV